MGDQTYIYVDVFIVVGGPSPSTTKGKEDKAAKSSRRPDAEAGELLSKEEVIKSLKNTFGYFKRAIVRQCWIVRTNCLYNINSQFIELGNDVV